MSESLGPGSTFAGCRLEAVAGRGGMGVVFRATQLALQRSVALKAIAPELAADTDFRERFQRESLLVASIDHPNVIPIYEAGELDGTLYLIMRWVDGTDLRTLLTTSGRVSPGRAIELVRPVASALAATHRRGLVHRDIKPANILIARGDEEDDDHVYLTDFGIARRTDGESVTRTGVFVGTVDYTAPERFEGGKGDAASDIYSLGCVLFEALTGHVPYARPTSVVEDLRARRRPDSVSAGRGPGGSRGARRDHRQGDGQAPGRSVRLRRRAHRRTGTGGKSPRHRRADHRRAGAAAGRDGGRGAHGHHRGCRDPERADRAGTRSRATPRRPDPTVDPPSESRVEAALALVGRAARPFLWVGPLVLLSLAGVLIATFSDNPESSRQLRRHLGVYNQLGRRPDQAPGGGLTLGRTLTLSGTPGSVSLGSENVWISLPDRGQLVRANMKSGARRTFPASGRPTALAAGARALWVAQAASKSLAQFNGDSGAQVHVAKLAGSPVAIALDQHDSTAWVADSSGAISHVDVGPEGIGTPAPVIGTPAHTDPAATSIAWGEGSLWAANGAPDGLVRVSLDTSGSSTAFPAGRRPVAVTLDQGVWIANANGHVTRFDPRAGQLDANADIAIAPELDAIAATDPGPFVWAMSKAQKTVYKVTNTSKPAVKGRIVFNSAPVALAVNANSVWVATQDRKVTEIRF